MVTVMLVSRTYELPGRGPEVKDCVDIQSVRVKEIETMSWVKGGGWRVQSVAVGAYYGNSGFGISQGGA
jgi:hypothetical protein